MFTCMFQCPKNPGRKGFLSLIILFSCLIFKSYGQDPHFSQFFEAPLLRNPSLAGIFEGDIRLQTVYRNQWQSVTKPPQ